MFKTLIVSYMLISPLTKKGHMSESRLKGGKIHSFFSLKKPQSSIAKGLQDGKADTKMGEMYDYFHNL